MQKLETNQEDHIDDWIRIAKERWQGNLGAHKLVIDAVKQVPHLTEGLDLGSGSCANGRFIASRGAHVTAIDIDPRFGQFAEMANRDLDEHCKNLNHGQVDFIPSRTEDFDFKPESYDIVVAINSLFFIDPDRVQEVTQKIYDSLKPGGQFVCTIISDQDSRCREGSATFCFTSEAEVRELFPADADVEITRFTQADLDAVAPGVKLPGIETPDFFNVRVRK